MRNCFVPGCDAFCKRTNTTQRKMFLPPSKSFQAWSEVLPNKRPLKAHDRVCERHFEEGDIIQFWESTINGQIHQTPRDKPKLRDNVIPCKNLPAKEIPEDVDKDSQKIEILSHKIIAPKRKHRGKPETDPVEPKKTRQKRTNNSIPVIEEIIEEARELTNFFEGAGEVDEVLKLSDGEMEPEVDSDQRLQMTAAFENLYDEAFDVTLPSLLWGIHRDPERKFMAFSEFNHSTMSCCKVLFIDENFNNKIFINNKLKVSRVLSLTQLEADNVSLMLDELDSEPFSPS